MPELYVALNEVTGTVREEETVEGKTKDEIYGVGTALTASRDIILTTRRMGFGPMVITWLAIKCWASLSSV
jgi:hypothetical protein